MADADFSIQCRCGRLRGFLSRHAGHTRATCYCRDCQAYAHALGEPGRTLDARGGTDVLATLQGHVRLTEGTGALACLSLKERGLLRWYAGCCHTPIANTARDPRLAYVGLVHTCLAASPEALEAAFGPTRLVVNTRHARGTPPRPAQAAWRETARIVASVAWARLSGAWRRSPFFDDTTHEPRAPARVLDPTERQRVYGAVDFQEQR